MIEEEVNEISRAYVTDYWFDDVEKDVTDLLNSDEWETVPQGNTHRNARANGFTALLQITIFPMIRRSMNVWVRCPHPSVLSNSSICP